MSGRTSVALVITELRVGGAEKALTGIAVGLDPMAFEVQIYSLAARPQPSQAKLVERLEAAGVAVHFLNARKLWHFPAILWKLRRFFKRQQPAVVLSFLYHANVATGWTVRFMHHGPRHIAGVRVAEPNACRLRIEAPLLRRAAAVTAVSNSLAEYVEQQQKVPRERITVIPNGVASERYAQAEPADLESLGISPERQLLTCVARLEQQKGLDWLLSGIDHLLARLPQYDLLLVGSGTEEKHLRGLAERSGCAARIHFAGQRGDIPAVLRRSSMLLLPSRYEGMPNVVLEAMAVGLPVVARNVEGVEEVLGTEAGPQVVDSYEVRAFYEAICNLAAHPAEQQRLGKVNQLRVSQDFSLAKMVRRYEELLRNASTRQIHDSR